MGIVSYSVSRRIVYNNYFIVVYSDMKKIIMLIIVLFVYLVQGGQAQDNNTFEDKPNDCGLRYMKTFPKKSNPPPKYPKEKPNEETLFRSLDVAEYGQRYNKTPRNSRRW